MHAHNAGLLLALLTIPTARSALCASPPVATNGTAYFAANGRFYLKTGGNGAYHNTVEARANCASHGDAQLFVPYGTDDYQVLQQECEGCRFELFSAEWRIR